MRQSINSENQFPLYNEVSQLDFLVPELTNRWPLRGRRAQGVTPR